MSFSDARSLCWEVAFYGNRIFGGCEGNKSIQGGEAKLAFFSLSQGLPSLVFKPDISRTHA